MASRTVIVFGPTGAIGSVTALTAAELGAKVILAMRDTKKPIPGLDPERERQGDFERIQADLTKPDTVHEAVAESGAKYAFIYHAHESRDHMKSTIHALKSAGIEFVVFNSSFTIQGDPKAIEPGEIIPYVHARVEVNLEEIFGTNGYVAARGGSYASNQLQYKAGIESGEVKMLKPEATIDCIAPEDIGRVCGTILAKGPQDERTHIYLYGPELLPQTETVRILAKALGKNPAIKEASPEEMYKIFVEGRGVPGVLAKYMVRRAETVSDEPMQVFGYPVTKEQLNNVEKYSGKKGTTFEEWVEKHKHMLGL